MADFDFDQWIEVCERTDRQLDELARENGIELGPDGVPCDWRTFIGPWPEDKPGFWEGLWQWNGDFGPVIFWLYVAICVAAAVKVTVKWMKGKVA